MKLNFSRVKLSLPDGHKEWQKEDTHFPLAELHHFRQEFGEDNCMALELDMESGSGDGRVFSNLCDITCEAWQNAAARWRAVNQMPVHFKSRVIALGLEQSRKSNRPYVPLPSDQASGFEQTL